MATYVTPDCKARNVSFTSGLPSLQLAPPVLPSSVAFNIMSFMRATPRSTSPFPHLTRVLCLSSQQPTGGCTPLGATLNPNWSQQTQTPPGAPLLKPSHLPHAPRHLGCPETPLIVCPWWVTTDLVGQHGRLDRQELWSLNPSPIIYLGQ